MVKIKKNKLDIIVTRVIGAIFLTIAFIVYIIVNHFVNDWQITMNLVKEFVLGILIIESVCFCEGIIRIKACRDFLKVENEKLFIKLGINSYDYGINQIKSYEYCKYKWFEFIFVYLKKRKGVLKIIFQDGEEFEFRVLYRDYLKFEKEVKRIN